MRGSLIFFIQNLIDNHSVIKYSWMKKESNGRENIVKTQKA